MDVTEIDVVDVPKESNDIGSDAMLAEATNTH
jgi:hypothetical protein